MADWKQGVGGVNWQDLIWPLVGGVAASWNEDIGRGVGHANAIFRTLQEERQNKAAQEEYRRILGPRIEELRARARGTDERDQVSFGDTWAPGYYGETGPVLPKPPRFSLHMESMTPDMKYDREPSFDIKAAEEAAGRKALLQQPVEQPLLTGKGPLQLPAEQQGPGLGLTDQFPMQGPLTGREGLPEFEPTGIEGTPDSEKAGNELRAYETLMALAGVNPSAAGYMMGQMQLGQVSYDQDLDMINKKLTAAGLNRRDKSALDMYTDQMKSAARRGDWDHFYGLKNAFAAKYDRYRFTADGMYALDKTTGKSTQIMSEEQAKYTLKDNQLLASIAQTRAMLLKPEFASMQLKNPEEASKWIRHLEWLEMLAAERGLMGPPAEEGSDGGGYPDLGGYFGIDMGGESAGGGSDPDTDPFFNYLMQE